MEQPVMAACAALGDDKIARLEITDAGRIEGHHPGYRSLFVPVREQRVGSIVNPAFYGVDG
jgi:hypothetical protein